MSGIPTPTPDDGRPDYDRTWFVHDDEDDRVFYRRDEGWFCLVNGCEFGAWRSRGEALAGMRTEQRRATRREWQPRPAIPSTADEG